MDKMWNFISISNGKYIFAVCSTFHKINVWYSNSCEFSLSMFTSNSQLSKCSRYADGVFHSRCRFRYSFACIQIFNCFDRMEILFLVNKCEQLLTFKFTQWLRLMHTFFMQITSSEKKRTGKYRMGNASKCFQIMFSCVEEYVHVNCTYSQQRIRNNKMHHAKRIHIFSSWSWYSIE